MAERLKKGVISFREGLKPPRVLPFMLFAFTLSACESMNTATITGQFHPGIPGSAHNKAPVASAGTIATVSVTPVSGTLVAIDANPSDTLTYSVVSQGTKGTVVITDNRLGTYTYSPSAGQVGADTFTFKANDGKLDSNIAVITVMISSGAPTALVFSTLPSSTGNTDADLGSQPEVTAKDAGGNTVGNFTNPIALSAYSTTNCSGSIVSGGLHATTNPVSAAGGVASFAGVRVLKTSVQSIRASDGTFAVCSGAMTVNHGVATQLAFSAEPGGAQAFSPLSTQPVVQVRDANGNAVTSGADSTANIEMSIDSGSGTLSGTTTIAAVGGVATFTDLSMDTPGAKTLLATKGSITRASTSLTITANAPSVPSGLSATGGSSHIALSWSTSTGGGTVTYNVLRSTTSGSGHAVIASGVATTSYVDLTALNGTTYFYVVQATSSGGMSANSDEVSARAISSFAISGVTVNNTAGGSALQVSWGAAIGAGTYTLKYGTSSGIYSTTVSSNATSPTTVSSLTPGTTYYFRVTAENSVGGGASVDATSEASGTPMAAFTLTAATRGSTSSSITWGTSAGSTSYTLKYGTASSTYGTTVSASATSPTNVTGLSPGTTYYFRVTAVNGNGSLDSTAELSQTTLQNFTQSWPFDFGTTSSYAYDTTRIDFTGGVCRLIPTDQTDDANDSAGFAGGTLTGATWDGTNGYLRLTQTGSPTNRAELDSSWAPKWASLVGYWKLNGAGVIGSGYSPDNISAAIGSAGSTNNVNNSGMSFSAGQLNSSVTFDGTDDYISVPDSSSLRFTTGDTITISAWVKPTSLAQYGTILVKGRSTGIDDANYAIRNEIGTGKLGFYYSSSESGFQTWTTTSSSALTVNQWQHVVVTYQFGTSNSVSAYINGNVVSGSWITGTGSVAPISTTNPLWIGANNAQGGGPIDERFTGSIDEVGIWNTALSASEVSLLYSRQSAKYSGTFASRIMDAFSGSQSWTTFSWIPTLPFFKELPDYASGAIQNESSTDYSSLVGSTGAVGDNNLMSGIVGLWHLNELTDNTVNATDDYKDSMGTRHGRLMGAGSILSADGLFQKAQQFDGTNRYFNTTGDLGTVFTVNNAPATLSVWVKPTTSGSLVWEKANGESGWMVSLLEISSACNVTAVLWRGVVTSRLIGACVFNQWNHIVWRYNGTQLTGAVNGVVDTVGTTTTKQWPKAQGQSGHFITLSNPTLNTSHAGSGGTPASAFYDELALWSRALGDSEIRQLYRRGATRIKYQVRICTTPNAGFTDCTDDPTGAKWKGPDGTNQTYFSELNNNTSPLAMTGDVKKGLPSMLFSAFTSPVSAGRYFQYRTILESDDIGTGCNYGSGATWCSPELKSVTVDPVHYDPSSPTIVGKSGVSYYSIASFAETLGASCSSGIGYNLGVGATYSSATWYYWNGSAWAAADGTATQSNSPAVISANAATFASVAGTGTVYFKAYLKSSGSTPCELDRLELTGQQ